MARKPRIEFEGAVYHIMSRGDRCEQIVEDDTDCTRFMECVEEVCGKTGWRMHAFCLLGNHYHALCETPEANLVAGMKWLQGTYTQRFNARHQRRGHVFQGRYKALLVDAESEGYFGTVSTYIHLNPARAGLIRREDGQLRDYPWSSYPLYLKRQAQRPQWLATERVLGDIGIDRDDWRGRREYATYLEGRKLELWTRVGRKELEREWKSIRRGWYLGSDEFRDRLQNRLEGMLKRHRRDSYDGEAVRYHNETGALHLLERGLEALGIRQADLHALPKNERRKAILAWLIRKNTTMSSEWISRQLDMGHISNVTNYIRDVEKAKDKFTRQLRARFA